MGEPAPFPGPAKGSRKVEITCPACQSEFDAPPHKDEILCPECGAALAIEEKSEGFCLVSACEPTGDRPSAPVEPEPNEENDPVMADYSMWRTGSLFAAILGGAGFLMIGLATYHDYISYGRSYVASFGNRLFLAAACLACGVLLAAGALVFRAAGRERVSYLERMKAQDPEAHPGKEAP